MCVCTAAFDTNTIQSANLHQKEGHLIVCSVICLFSVSKVNRFEAMIDFLRDGSACPVFCKTLRVSGLNG